MALVSLRRWLAPSRPAPRPRRTFRPRVEGLEDRLTPAGGLLDPTFGTGGIGHLPTTPDSEATAVAVQPDGKVVVVGQITRKVVTAEAITVQRLNRDGSLDTSFNGTGSATIQTEQSDWPTSVALQPDGKILVGGIALSNNFSLSGRGSHEFLVARVNANGTLDTTFASKGLWVYASPNAELDKLAVLTDPAHPAAITGIVAAAQGNANGATCFEAIKLTPAGVPDRTFGSGGFATFAGLSNSHSDQTARSVAVAPSGEIYLAGAVEFGGMTAQDACIAAVTPSGALDTAFGGGSGYVLAVPAGNQGSTFYDVAIQTLTVNGQAVSRVIAAGYITIPNVSLNGYAAAYTLGGMLDTSFGSGGSFVYPDSSGNTEFTSLTLEADGSIVVGGWQVYLGADGNYHREMLVGHLTANGTVDTSFGTAGTGFVGLQDVLNSDVSGLALDPTDGSILACGSTSATTQSPPQAVVVRLTAP
jgi:uncharacterized delta-60 repeat protein